MNPNKGKLDEDQARNAANFEHIHRAFLQDLCKNKRELYGGLEWSGAVCPLEMARLEKRISPHCHP